MLTMEAANNMIYKTMHPDNLPRMNALLEFTLTQLIVKYDVVCSLANFERQSNFWRVYQPVACNIFSIQLTVCRGIFFCQGIFFCRGIFFCWLLYVTLCWQLSHKSSICGPTLLLVYLKLKLDFRSAGLGSHPASDEPHKLGVST